MQNSREIAEFYTETLQNALPESIYSEIPIFSCGDVISYSAQDIVQLTTVIADIVQKLKPNYDYGEVGIICLRGIGVQKELCKRLESIKIPTTIELEACNKILVTLPRIIRGYEKKIIIVVTSSEEYMTKDLGKAINSYIALSRARDRLFIA